MTSAYKITDPSQMNATFTKAFNDNRDIDGWISLYEPTATLIDGPIPAVGHEAVRNLLTPLTKVPGVMETKLNFHAVNGDISVLRADYRVVHEGRVTVTGSTIEVARRQPNGTWLYIIDNATGASAPSVWDVEAKKD